MSKFTYGSDPELMVQDKDDVLRSAIPILVSTNENPTVVNGHSFYHDNVNVEMAIRPGSSKSEVINNFREAFTICADMIRPYRLVPRASGDFLESDVEDLEAKKINCNPEFCAYDLCELPKPIDEFQGGVFRSAGGHVHLGSEVCDLSAGYEFIFVVRLLDLFLGIPSLWLDKDPTSAKRRALYGAAGSHRQKDYGLEYRALGNFWLGSPNLVGLVYDLCGFTLGFAEQGGRHKFWVVDQNAFDEGEQLSDCIKSIAIDDKNVRKAINTNNKELAKVFLAMAKSYMPKSLQDDLTKMFDYHCEDFYKEWEI